VSPEPQAPDASPDFNRYIRHVYVSAPQLRTGGEFHLNDGEYIMSAVFRTDGNLGVDLLIVGMP